MRVILLRVIAIAVFVDICDRRVSVMILIGIMAVIVTTVSVMISVAVVIVGRGQPPIKERRYFEVVF